MDFEQVMQQENVSFAGIEAPYFLLGLLSAFDNRFQAAADKLIGAMSWKQFFAVICIHMCREAPGIKELAGILGTSHQNTKQILLKLEKKGFVRLETDEKDRRKQRVQLTESCRTFCEKNDEIGIIVIQQMFSGIAPEDLQATIRTIMQMESNLKGLGE